MSPQAATALQITRGDTSALNVTCYQSDGVTALNITGYTLWWTAKNSASDADPGVIQKTTTGGGITITNAAGGIATVNLVPADTSGLSTGVALLWDLQAKDGSGNITTLAAGMVAVTADITRAIS